MSEEFYSLFVYVLLLYLFFLYIYIENITAVLRSPTICWFRIRCRLSITRSIVSYLLENAASHCVHLYFLSPVCSLIWRSLLLLCLKRRLQNSQRNGMWSLCVCKITITVIIGKRTVCVYVTLIFHSDNRAKKLF